MILSDFHVHTDFCDGADSPEAIAVSAIDRGMTHLGFSGHSHTPCDESYCMTRAETEEYIREITRLKNKYSDKIHIFCGIEQDFFSDMSTDRFDYVIGSVHYLEADGEYFPIDENPEILHRAAEEHFDGDFYALAEKYFDTVARLPQKTDADIIGHFDLISKFNEGGTMFDDRSPRYLAAAERAAYKLIACGAVFEINTGAISRGYRTAPYPLPPLLGYILKKGGKTLLSSDSHSRETLCFKFDEYEHLANQKTF